MGEKPFLTYEQLVAKLRDEKKMTIPDNDKPHVIRILKEHSYFALICGYKMLFKQKDGNYKIGTKIDDIYALYEFDSYLRDIFLNKILIIEKHVKSLLSYAFTEKFGDRQIEYLKPENYNYICSEPDETYRKCIEVKKLVNVLSSVIKPPFDHKYIEHQWQSHQNIPLWTVVKAITFGNASKMYSLCFQDIQAGVSKEFPGVTESILVGMLDFLSIIRNVCAHNERLYDYKVPWRLSIKDMPIHKALNIGKNGEVYKKGKKDLFAALICFKYLLNSVDLERTVIEIKGAIDHLKMRTKLIPENQILYRMGFPENWQDILIY